MANFLDSLKKALGLGGGDDETVKRPVWKKINTLAMVAAAGILLIMLTNVFSMGETKTDSAVSITPNQNQEGALDYQNFTSDIPRSEEVLGRQLERVLAQIDGVGEVQVTVNLASTTQKDYATNTTTNSKMTQEDDQRGGHRTITETNENDQMVLMRINQGSKEEPIVVKEVKPEVKGVIVVAQGAGDPMIKSDLMRAVQIYFDVPLYKVVVLQKGSR